MAKAQRGKDLRDKLAEARRVLQSTLAAGAQSLQELRARQSELRARREYLLSAPLSKADLLTALSADITQALHAAVREPNILGLLSELQTRAPEQTILGSNDRADYAPLPKNKWSDGGRETVLLLFAALADADTLAKAFEPALDQLDFSKAGPALAARRREIAEIDAQLAEIEVDIRDAESLLGAAKEAS